MNRKNDPKDELTVYDARKLYTEQIRPHIVEIKKICKLNKVPFVCTCATANDEKGTTYENDGVLTGSNNINLKEDRFIRYLLVIRGAELAPIGSIKLDKAAIDYIGEPPENIDGDGSDEAECPGSKNGKDNSDNESDMGADVVDIGEL